MESEAGTALGGRHFSGTNTRMLLEFVQAHLAPREFDAMLYRARLSHSLDALLDDATWTTYAEFRRLLEAAADALGGREALHALGREARLTASSVAERVEMLRTLGSPAAMYASLPAAAHVMTPLVVLETRELGPTSWSITLRWQEGFEPFRAFCSYSIGLYSLTPRLFGLAAADVVEHACQCDGAPQCEFVANWDPDLGPAREVAYLDLRNQMLEARLQSLEATVARLVTTDDLRTLLTHVVESTARAVSAPAHILVLDPLVGVDEYVYTVGLNAAEAEMYAADIAGDGPPNPNCLVADVVSATRRYGRLAAINPTAQFLAQEVQLLETYARLVAAALDGAVALEASRREARVSAALHDLAISLAEILTPDEIAVKLAGTVMKVADCDGALVLLADHDTALGRVAASAGYDPELDAQLQSRRLDLSDVPIDTDGRVDLASGNALAQLAVETHSVAAVSVPIVLEGELVGHLLASVTNRPERLDDADVVEHLRGIAGQVATAFRNLRLLDQIRHQALHDSLTGLPNRVLIMDRAEQTLARARRHHTPVAALFIDLDNFKTINDTLGHGVGDELLKAVAERFTATLRGSDTVGRLGGDEFVVLAEGISVAAGPELLAERLRSVLREPFHLPTLDAAPLCITASIGIAVGDRESPGELLRDADIALYRAKAGGRDCYAVFAPSMQSEVLARLELELDLRSALELRQFFLVYQPIFDLVSGAISGAEALLRWRHPQRGVLTPDEFVPLLEESGLIREVGRWVLNEACRQASAWHEQGCMLNVSVNVSMKQLETDAFLDDVSNALAASGLHPSFLTVETTETALMQDAEGTARRLGAVKALGVRVAIDDFGTGYSSLAYLSQFPVDALKIDKSFVNGMTRSQEATALLQTLLQLGRALQLETLAEGIEEPEQLAQLRDQCDSGQGFLISQPLEPEQVPVFIAEWVNAGHGSIGRERTHG